ncbi:MAG: ATP-binding protein [Bacteroidaceae bacterium]|nr:ATP-binding protein [Bacteroidaceae bacterium]
MEILSRPEYLQEIHKHLGKQTIVVLTGQRRVGKSYVLLDLKKELSADPQNNVIFIDKEKKAWKDIKTDSNLNDYVDARIDSTKTNYILIDEVQEIKDFENSLRDYRTEEGVEIVVTGSNAETLSSDLSTKLGGRHHEVYVQSLCYLDFLRFHSLADSDESLQKYIEVGGLPGLRLHNLEDIDDVRTYCEDVLNTALIKDIILKHKIRNVSFLYNLVRFLADNTGKLISATSISKYMRGREESVSTDLALKYIKYLCDAYIVHKVERFEIRGKKLLESNDKYYFEDAGIRNTQTMVGRDKDIEKVIENIIYQQLIHNGYKVQVGQLQAGEIDFVCTKGTSKIYVQASYLIASEETREREFGALKKIKDNYPKYVISMTPLVTRTDDDGIIHLSLREFLARGF